MTTSTLRLDTAKRKHRQRKRPQRSRRTRLFEQLEPRLALAGILPASIAHPLGGSPVTGNAVSESATISADGRYVVFLSDATNLVANQEDTIREGERFRDVFLWDRTTNETRLVSGSQGSSTKTGDNQSESATISANGRYVAFTSRATDLVIGQNEAPGAANFGFLDLFLFDRDATTAADRIRLVSHTSDSLTTPANNPVLNPTPTISADGRHIAFTSFATDMVAGITDSEGTSDVFLYDRDASTLPSITLVSRSATLDATAAGFDAGEVALSADGNSVVFQSSSTDLVTDQVDTNNFSDIFHFDASENRLRLVSGSAGSETNTASGFSFQAAPLAISAHGRYVAFKSFATDLVPGQIDANNNADLFLFDRDAVSAADRLRLISHAHDSDVTAATGAAGFSEVPVINVDLANDESSGAGLFVAFQSAATNLVAGVTDTETRRDLFVYDLSTGDSVLATHAAAGQGTPATTASPNIPTVDNGPGRTPVISRNGRFVAYSSPATDLVANQVDSTLVITNDVFVYDRLTGVNSLLSGADGSATTTGDSSSHVNGISADGLIVAFSSDATDLINGDTNAQRDAYVSVTQPPLIIEFRGRPLDRMSSNALNQEDGVRDGLFAITRPLELGDGEITSLELERSDGTRWSTAPTGNERILGVADSLLHLIASGVQSTVALHGGQEFVLLASDVGAANTLFTVGERFTLTAHFADGTSVVVESPPIPGPVLEFNGRLRDRVGRGETSLTADGQRDGTFSLTLQPGHGRVTSLDLNRGDGNRWNTIPSDTFWVLGTADSLDGSLLNNADGSLPTSHEALNFFNHGGSLTLFAPEDRPEATSFFTIGKTFTVRVGYDDGSFDEASVLLTADNVPPSRPNLAVRITDSPDPVAQFQESKHTITVRNNGDAPATNVQVRTDRLDQLTSNGFAVSVQFVKGNSSATCDQLSSRVICTLDTIAPGTEKSVDIAYLFETPRPVTIGAIASATESDANTEDDSDSETTQVVGLVQTGLAASAGQVEFALGLVEDLTYAVTVTNTNPLPIADVTITNPVPDNVTLLSVRNTQCNVSSGVFTCHLPQLDPNETAILRYVVRPRALGNIQNDGVTVQQGGLRLGGTDSIDVTVVPPADTDGDSLYDRWETSGVDVNSDGIVDLDLPALGSKPDHKDLFVEADFMGCVGGVCPPGGISYQPIKGSMAKVVEAFKSAPVGNPDRTSGINLHIYEDEPVLYQPTTRFVTYREGDIDKIGDAARGSGANDDFGDIKLGSNSTSDPGTPCGTGASDGHFGTVAERSSDNCGNILIARHLTFRYAVFVSGIEDDPDSTGIAELPPLYGIGDDIMLATGHLTDAEVRKLGGSKNLAKARRALEATNFMHELGHTLGLGHGGGNNVNRKPNYLSIMNYNLSYPYLDPTSPLDYSRQALADLDENNLNEVIGVGGPAGRNNFFRSPKADEDVVSFSTNEPIDWNRDGDKTDVELHVDVNLDGTRGVLTGYDDWQNLVYGFGGRAATATAAASVSESGSVAEAIALAQSFDFDDDGLFNADDNCSGIPNADQADADANGIGDACQIEPNNVDLSIRLSDNSSAATKSGEDLHYAFVLTNSGTQDATGVTLASVLSGVTYISATLPSGATCGVDVGVLNCMGLTVPSGTSIGGTLVVRLTAAGTLAQKFTVASTESDSDSADNAATQMTIVGTPTFPWQNPRNGLDTNNDGTVSSIDALLPINELNEPTITGVGGQLPTPPLTGITFYYDVNPDGILTPLDPLLVINFLNDPTAGESESVTPLSVFGDVTFSPAPSPEGSDSPLSGSHSATASAISIALRATPIAASPISPARAPASGNLPKASDFKRAPNHAYLADAFFASFDEWQLPEVSEYPASQIEPGDAPWLIR